MADTILGCREIIWFARTVFMVVLIVGCGNTDSETDAVDSGLDSGSDGGESSTADQQGNHCTELTLNLHEGAGQALVTLSSMTATHEDSQSYDFAMVNQMPEPPAIYLGPGVQAIDMGHDQGFLEVVEAPSEGYADDGDDPVVGTGWRTGGSGGEGHEMSWNVYVLKTASGSFGKIMVTSAKAGIATLDAYYQTDGSADLQCAFKD